MNKTFAVITLLVTGICVTYAAESKAKNFKPAEEFLQATIDNNQKVIFNYLQKELKEELLREVGSEENAIEMLKKNPGKQFFDDFKIVDDDEIKVKVVHVKLRSKQDNIWKDYYIKFMLEDKTWSFLSISNSKHI